MSDRYICIHGHFYQPPRENPWLEAIEIQDSAFPYHDWNERVSAECYAANAVSRALDQQGRIAALVNNYARISFNFGPTVLLWMERFAVDAYQAILEADKQSMEKYSGHGSALAQAYNHMILPLANTSDKYTQILWGIKDFEYRYKRKPEGMWLPETAVDLESLDMMAELGIVFAILAPRQAQRVRSLTGGEWQDAGEDKTDPGMPYQVSLPSGRVMSLYFYDGPLSRAVAFEGLLDNGEDFANRLMSGFPEDNGEARLVHIATDGESYGHHHRGGEMALTRALDYIESNGLAQLTNYGQYLEKYPPTHEVEIVENSSWSCIHGIERWKSDCGCDSGGHQGWNQAWRAPLREALDWLRDTINPVFEQSAKALLRDPWAARNEYINVVLNRSPERVGDFFSRQASHPLRPEEEITVLKLMELQRHAMLMYTSCGWFFDELSGIETVQIIQYAGRVLQLADQLFSTSYEPEFLDRLELAKSNITELRDGRGIYDRFVKPTMIDLINVGAHFAMSSLFKEYGERDSIYSYSVATEDYRSFQAGRMKLAVGRMTIASDVTHASTTLFFGVLHHGDHNITYGIGEYLETTKYEAMVKELSEAFSNDDLQRTLNILDEYFTTSTYALSSLFSDERCKILGIIMEPTLREAQAAYDMVYENHAPLIRYLKKSGAPLPKALYIATEMCLNAKIETAFKSDAPELQTVKPLLEEAQLAGITLDATRLGFLLKNTIGRMAEQLFENPDDFSRMEPLNRGAILARAVPFEVNLWKPQALCFTIIHTRWADLKAKADQGDNEAQEWIRGATLLAENYSVQLP
jgi:alpha-amylase/alpha-mannosidase (GH57 family)